MFGGTASNAQDRLLHVLRKLFAKDVITYNFVFVASHVAMRRVFSCLAWEQRRLSFRSLIWDLSWAIFGFSTTAPSMSAALLLVAGTALSPSDAFLAAATLSLEVAAGIYYPG